MGEAQSRGKRTDPAIKGVRVCERRGRAFRRPERGGAVLGVGAWEDRESGRLRGEPKTQTRGLGSGETPEVLTAAFHPTPCVAPDRMIEVVCNDRLGKKVRVKCKYPPAAERPWFLGCLT